jgi:hypothetical protein
MPLGSYKVHYAGGDSKEIPVLIGSHVRDWFYYPWQPLEVSEAPLVWVGLNERARVMAQSFTSLYLMSWTNPAPDTLIERIEFFTSAFNSTLFLVALTAELPGQDVARSPSAAAPEMQTVLGQTLRTLDEAIALRPDHFAFLQAKAGVLERHDLTNEALATLSKVISETDASGGSASNLLTSALEARSALLRRMNRFPEAQADRLRALGIPVRAHQTETNLIDLTDHYNGSLTRGWIPSSAYGTTVERNLGELPQGIQTLGGVRFDVRGLIQLAGHSLNVVLRASFPVEVKGVRVGQPCHRLHFLQATGWRMPDGTAIGRYVIHYVDGQQQAVPVVYGENVRDWWFDPKLDEPTKGAVVAWTGKNAATETRGQAVRLYRFTWENPRADAAIESLDLVSENSNSSPFLIALTVE